MRGFLLGLSNGAICLTSCAPVLIPYLLGEAKAVAADFGVLAAFLAGRLLGYLTFAVLAWSTGQLLHPDPSTFARLIALAFVLLGVLMVFYGFVRPRILCAASAARWLLRWKALAWTPLLPGLLGLLTGLNLCPPFLLALTEAAAAPSLAGSLLFFFTFFLGTSALFLPFPALGLLRRQRAVQTVGRLAAVVVGVIYCWMGVGMLR